LEFNAPCYVNDTKRERFYDTNITFKDTGEIDTRLVIYSGSARASVNPYSVALNSFEKKYQKFERNFYRHVDRKLRRIKPLIKKQVENNTP
jgi:hypothetical protein